MECREIKELLSAWTDGETSAEEARLVEGHLADCGSCRLLARRMSALAEGLAGMECAVSPRFREELFARMEREELLPSRRASAIFSLRWAAVPLAAAAALALFVLVSREERKVQPLPAGDTRVAERAPAAGGGAVLSGEETSKLTRGGGEPRTAAAPPRPGAAAPRPPAATAEPHAPSLGRALRAEAELSREEREIVAYLELLEDPQALDDEAELDEWDPPGPGGRERG